MNLQEAEALAEKWLPLWTGNQPEALAAVYSENVFYRDPAKPEGIKGRPALLGYFRKLLAANPHWRWFAVELIPTEKGVTAKWRAEIPVAEELVEEYGLDIVEVDNDGLICRNEVYFDRAALLAAIARARK